MLTFVKRTARRFFATVPGQNAVRAVVTRRRLPRLLDTLAVELAPVHGRDVAVLAPAGQLAQLERWQGYLAGDTVHLVLDREIPGAGPTWAASVDTARTADEVAAAIARRAGAIDLLIDLRWAAPKRYMATWVSAAGLLRDGGAYVVFPPDLSAVRICDALHALIAALKRGPTPKFDGRPVRRVRGIERDLLGATLVTDEAAVLTKRRTRFRFLADEGIEVSIAREVDVTLRVIDELAEGVLHAKGALTSHESSAPVAGLPAELAYPRLQLRHYEGRIEFFGQTLLVSGRSILPDSHRFYRRPNNDYPLHPRTAAIPGRRDVVMIPSARRPRPKLAGSYYLLDPQITGHYGHILTETVPRLWGWDLAKQLYPDLKTLTKVRRGHTDEPVLERLLNSYGIDSEDIVLVDHPVQLESVITASAMWHNFAPHFVHPNVQGIWDRIGAQLIDPSAPSWDRLFLTRPPEAYRTCYNVVEVEALFRDHGFQILRPEQYDLGIQAGIFRTAKVVAGFGGSAMFNLMYSNALQNLIVLNPESFTARNEHLYASVLGADEDWFWSVPDEREFHSNWTFDFDRNVAPLRALLNSL